MESSYGLKIMATHFYISQAYFGQFSQLALGHRHSKTHLKFYFYFHILSLKIPLAANSLVLALKCEDLYKYDMQQQPPEPTKQWFDHVIFLRLAGSFHSSP